ncbi:helix-turn-helix domain-containing protein [Patiriisocius marinus]|uniref:Transcriptional regulator n=1 Tax=Patiriisocius marinus TaxID=1397112 RepID=A0A5J4J7N9_9FLAO|nr:helix-turn-helix transcriptional regulator [Patiriisocius marinus]GER60537.1 transcriptional regulator [Patiriisocius marinus]
MVNSAHFAKRLQKILEYYGLSATAFSEELSFNRSTISHLLSGRNKPSLEFVMKVLERFPEVELHWLLNGKGTFPTSKNDEENIAKLKEEILKLKKNPPVQVEKIASEKVISEIENPSLQNNETQAASQIKISEAFQKNNPIERIVIFYTNGTFKEYKSE